MKTTDYQPHSEHPLPAHIAPWWKIWANPLLMRYIRSRLRLRRSLGWILTIVIVSSFMFFMIFLTSVNRELASSRDAARGVLMPMFILQGIIMMLMGTGSVASGLVQDKINGTMDYQRLTPMSPLAKIVGYLFGLPIREYLLFAITLPYTVFCLVVGRVPPDAFIPVYVIFFTSVLLYHLTGMAAGMITRKWRFTARITQGLVILLYLVLPQFSHLGLYGFQYLTVRPVVAAELFPLIPPQFIGGQNSTWQGIDSVPFFTWEFSSFWFSFVLQGLLILVLGTMSYRKWRDQNQHALSKPYGTGVFVMVIIMILGNLWPVLTRQTAVDLPIFGGVGTAHIDEGVAVVLPLIMSIALLFTGMWILQLVTPSHHEVLRGWRRVVKFGEPRLGWWRNEAPSGLVLGVMILVSVIAVYTELGLLVHHGFLSTDAVSFLDRLGLPLALVIALLSFYAALISLENRRIFIVLLLGWGLPGLIAILMGAAFSSYQTAVYLSSLSPLFLILYGGLFLQTTEINNTEVVEFQQTSEKAFWIGLLIQTIFITWLLIRWSGLFNRLARIAKSGSKDVPASLLVQDIED